MVLLEGGYDLEAGSNCGLAVTQALLGEEFADELGPAPLPESGNWEKVIEEVKRFYQ
jgi:acetoin utilization deacetylase AcuC-like enzyme